MSTSFFSLEIGRKRDVMVARQRTRQIARLLGFECSDEAALAATVFALARNCLAQSGAVTLHFRLRRNMLQVVPELADPASIPFEASARWSTWRVEKPLPHNDAAMTVEDLAWSLQTMSEFAPVNVFDEIAQHNDDLLHLLRELRECRNELADLKQQRTQVAAA